MPVQITPKTLYYWHGVSPDGGDIVYCAERNGNYDVYKMNIDGGEEIRLTSSEGWMMDQNTHQMECIYTSIPSELSKCKFGK